MPKLFRSNRFKSFVFGKVKNYFFYAIGEISLIVIGILIALSIGNWNEDRKDRIKEQIILSQLKIEFNTNLLQLEEKISTRKSIIRMSREVLKSMNSKDASSRDSLITRFAYLVIDPTFDPIVNDLIGSGNIRLIQNEQLKRLLTNWTSDAVSLQEIEKRWTKTVDDLVIPYYVELGISRDAIDRFFVNHVWSPFALDKLIYDPRGLGQSNKSPSAKEILASIKLEGIMSISIALNEAANIQSYALQSRINEILQLVNNEIN